MSFKNHMRTCLRTGLQQEPLKAHDVQVQLSVVALLMITVFLSPPSMAQSTPTPQQLLENYQETRHVLETQISRLRKRTVSRETGRPERVSFVEADYRNRSNGPWEDILTWWIDPYSKEKPLDPNKAIIRHQLWDGEFLYSYETNPFRPGNRKSNLVFWQGKTDMLTQFDARGSGIGIMEGYFRGDQKHVIDVLKSATDIKCRAANETVNGFLCHVIEAKTTHGQYTLWLDSQHGYNVARAEIRKQKGDIHDGRPLGTLPEMTEAQRQFYHDLEDITAVGFHLVLTNTRFEKLKGTWVPMEADYHYSLSFQSGRIREAQTTLERTAINLEPDFKAINAFTLNVANGTPAAKVDDDLHTKYVWTNGKIEIADVTNTALTKDIEKPTATKTKKDPNALPIGQAAPLFIVQTLDGKELQLSDYRGKAVLLYFWALWCSPCVASAPALKEFYNDLSQHDDFAMISLSHDDDTFALKRFIAKHKLTWPQVCLGRDSDVAMAYHAQRRAPVYVVIDRKGNVLLSGETNWNKIKAAIDKDLSN